MHDFKLFPELTNNQLQFYYFESPHRQILEDFEAKVIRVKDGDTIQVKWQDRDFDFPVRLLNIDSSELEEHGIHSKNWLEKEILGENVLIKIDSKQRVGKFGRILGEVIFNGQSMNQLSLDLGYSVVFGSDDAT